jgi:hypothetical protein
MREKFSNIDYKMPCLGHSGGDGITFGDSSMLFEKKIWRVGDVASFLDCTKGHVYNLASDEKIPKRKKNGFLFFVPDEILNWILEGE